MNREYSSGMDEIDRQLVGMLQGNARLTFKELGRAVHLSSTAAAERVRRLEEAGVIAGYAARIDPVKAGNPIRTYIRLRTSADQYPRFLVLAEDLPEILECHHVTGDDSFLILAALGSMEELEGLIARISPFGETSTALVMSTPLKREVKV
ncbi:MAG: Lrp/AsnC family transcriptional regulator [Anaerolineaceae bacterium]